MGFIWVPAHIGIERHEEVDEIAKKQKTKPVYRNEAELELMYGRVECKNIIQQGTTKLWQKEWEEGNKSRFI